MFVLLVGKVKPDWNGVKLNNDGIFQLKLLKKGNTLVKIGKLNP